MTEYAIKLKCGVYLADIERMWWTEETLLAHRFGAQTTALFVAIEWLDLLPGDFTIEPVDGLVAA